MEDFSSTVEHLELPRQHVHFNRNRKRAKPWKKGRESLIWFCIHFQFQERVLSAFFWSSNFSNRPCSGFLVLWRSLKCHGIAVKTTTMAVVQLPKSLENRSTTTPLVGKPGPPCLRWTSRNVFYVTLISKTRSCWSQEALTRCTLNSTTTILLSAARIRKDDVCSLRSTSRQTFKRRKWCTMPHATESTPAPSPWTPLPLPTRRMPKVLLIIQRLIPMTATRHDMAFRRLGSMIEELITDDAYCTMSMSCAIWLNAPPWIWCGPNSRWCIQPDAKITWMSLKRYTSAQNMPILCQQK